MKWSNFNKWRYLIRIIRAVYVIYIACIIIIIFLSQKMPVIYSVLFVMLIFLIPLTISWAKKAKYKIQNIEIIEDFINIYYQEYNKNKFVKCDINKIKIELWGRHHGGVYLTVHINEQLILKQEDFYWKSIVTLKELHAELKKVLPYKTVLPAL